jgi:DNA-binding PadR family transcriptional regulator
VSELGNNDPRLLVLISLAAGPRHGHGILLDVGQFARVRLGPGTLYGAIARLEADGLIEPTDAVGRRRPYRLTDRGSAVLLDRLRALDQAVATGLRRVEGRA